MIAEILRYISIWIVFIPFLVGVMNYQGLDADSRWIFLLVVCAIAPQVLTIIYVTETPVLNISYNLYTVVEFFIVYKIFISKFISKSLRTVMRVSAGLYAICVLFFLFSDGFMAQFINVLVCFNGIIYLLWILLLLKQEYGSDHDLIRLSNPFTWYLIALIMYAPCTLIVFSLYYFVRTSDHPELINLWMIQSVCNILLYLLFSVGLLFRKRRNFT